MKRTLDELLTAVNAIVGEDNTDDAVIALIEDLTDTLTAEAPAEPDTDLAAEVERLKEELQRQKKIYKDRFLGKVPEEETEEDEAEETETKPDGDKITITDIFKDKED